MRVKIQKLIPVVFVSVTVTLISGIVSRPPETSKRDNRSTLIEPEADTSSVNHADIENRPNHNGTLKPPENNSNSDGNKIRHSKNRDERSSTIATSTASSTNLDRDSYTSTESSRQSQNSDYPYPSPYYPPYLTTVPMLPAPVFQRPQPYIPPLHSNSPPHSHQERKSRQHSSNYDPNLSQPIIPRFVHKLVVNVTNYFN